MKILILSSHTKSLFWFRMEMMEAFQKLGHKVIAAAQENTLFWEKIFLEKGIEYRHIFVRRNSINPIFDIRTLLELNQLIKEVKPDIIFVYQSKTIIYGSLAAAFNNIKEFYPLVAGLGSVFRGEGIRNKILSKIIAIQYKWSFKMSRKVIFQNKDDSELMVQKKILHKSQVEIINGSGVNLEKFKPTPLPKNPAFLFIGRLIKDKGIMEYLHACKILKSKYDHVRCLLVGPFDTNPSALKPYELFEFINCGVIEYFGEQDDVRPYIEMCSTFVLPSYHEGTPKTVLEAMAMGRPIITSNVPGCRETVIEEINGYLIEPKNIDLLVNKMEFLILNPEINCRMGIKSLEMANERFDVHKVNAQIIRIMNLKDCL